MRDEVRDKITQTTYTEAFVLSDVRDEPISKTVNPNKETSSVANRFLRELCSKQSGSLLGAKQEFARSKVGAVQTFCLQRPHSVGVFLPIFFGS